MTYRERRMARADRLDDWATKRSAKSAAAFNGVHAIADNIPLGQPLLVGHHSYKRALRDQERISSGMRRGIDHADMAASMSSRADNIRSAADHAIYSDDEDATDKLRAKIAGLEAERDEWTAYNAACRAAGRCTAEALALLSPKQRDSLDSVVKYAPYQLRKSGQAPAYVTSNLSGNISRARERLATLEEAPA